MMTLHCILLPEDPAELYGILYPLAEPERKMRADRYLRREDGLRCLAAGELLRRTVEKALGLTDFQVITEPGGKPRIAGHDAFHYNLSHSGLRVAIDRPCASGKSTLGAALSEIYGCALIHMDDFFLRPEQRTSQRLSQPVQKSRKSACRASSP